jgi:hypothetical protein
VAVLRIKKPASRQLSRLCGERGIRTPGAPKGTTVFETAPFNHSGISPSPKNNYFYGMKMIYIVRNISILILLICSHHIAYSQETTVKIGLLKYSGGGDWYANPTSLPNLIQFCNNQLGTNISPEPSTVEPGSRDIFFTPFIHLTGHGNIVFSQEEVSNLNEYLTAGGFLHIDDNYGLDPFIRREMKKVFPDLDFVEIPPSHPVFTKPFSFPDGIPKIHEHDQKRPQAFGLFLKGRMICFYSFESDLGDGWESQEVHNDSETVRLKALQMGANLIQYVFTER